MNKNLIIIFLSICALYFSCSKANRSDINPGKLPTSTTTIKLTLVSGSGQTDTIGNPLSNPIIVKVTQDGAPVSGYTVKFSASGCNQTDTISTTSQTDGAALYSWSLAGDAGQQNLKAYVLNSNNQKVDSITASATALSTGPGWHRSGCSLQGSASAVSFCKLSNGRLFTCFIEKTYLRYSDDNGVSWNAVKSLGNTHTIMRLVATPNDEVFAFTTGSDGTFYSNDGGQTWSNLGTAPFNTETVSSIVCTPSGKLIATSSTHPPFFISLDKGKTWTITQNSSFIPVNNTLPLFNDPSEDRDGNLYVVEQQNGNMFKTTDEGTTWNLIPETGYNSPGDVFSLYIDKNNWFYKSTYHFQPGIYISKDNGSTYNILIPYGPAAFIENMSVQSDGIFYYEDIATGLYSYDGNSSKLVYGYSGTLVQPYIVAKNNNIIFANEGQKYIRYYSK
jgi:hypothetical protein